MVTLKIIAFYNCLEFVYFISHLIFAESGTLYITFPQILQNAFGIYPL